LTYGTRNIAAARAKVADLGVKLRNLGSKRAITP